MNRQKILVAACVLASISIGTNAWFLWRKNGKPAAEVTKEKTAPELRLGSEMDFNGTGLQDGVWKLDDDGAGKKVPVFEESGLTNDSWKLGDGKEKAPEMGPFIGPPKSEAPPPPAPAPQSKSASRGPEAGRPGTSASAFVEEVWNLSRAKQLPVDWDKPFDFEDFSQREQHAVLESMTREVDDFQHNRRGPFDNGDRLKDTAGTVPVFERRFLGRASNLRGFEFREVNPGPARGRLPNRHLPR